MRFHASSSGKGMIGLLESMQLSRNELSVYNLLARRPLTIKQIIKRTSMSERMIRTYLDDLVEKNFVYKKAVITKSFKYVYYGNPEESIADMFIRKVKELEARKAELLRKR